VGRSLLKDLEVHTHNTKYNLKFTNLEGMWILKQRKITKDWEFMNLHNFLRQNPLYNMT
jgi:hypothetical protein